MDNKSQNSMTQVLSDMNREAQFPVATLSSRDGLLVAASASNGNNPAKQSAVVAKLVEAANLMRSHLDFGKPEELSFFAEGGRRLVCRTFNLSGRELILAVLIPKRGQAYRRATSKAIARLTSVWKTKR